jgi:hypothetical protein
MGWRGVRYSEVRGTAFGWGIEVCLHARKARRGMARLAPALGKLIEFGESHLLSIFGACVGLGI